LIFEEYYRDSENKRQDELSLLELLLPEQLIGVVAFGARTEDVYLICVVLGSVGAGVAGHI
jgi:succinate dehydrogenase/fumarate reductase flavoprotein subunit